MASKHRTVGVEPWDVDWAAERAAEAIRYLGRNYSEALTGSSLRALDAPEEAANAAARRGDKEGYLAALREYCRAGRDEALRIRKGAA